jgi:uncharacterized protein DUF4383
MLKTLAVGFGIIFILLGILGFIPAAAPNNLFLGIFPVEGPGSTFGIIEDTVSLIAGSLALWCGLKGAAAAKRYFQILGFIFLFLATLGFIYRGQNIFGLIPNSAEDMLFNFVFALLFIAIGFGMKAKPKEVNG